MSRLIPVTDENINVVLNFINAKVEKLGTVLPVDKKTFYKYFPEGKSFAVLGKTGIESVFIISRGRGKGIPTIRTRIYASSIDAMRNTLEHVKKTALTMEALYLRTSIFSYSEENKWLKKLGFVQGALIPDAACLRGKLYNIIYYYYDLRSYYDFEVQRKYVSPSLYNVKPVKKKKPEIIIRGLRIGDLDELEWVLNHPNVYITMGSGFYEGLTWYNRQRIIELVSKGKLLPLVAQNATDGRIIGTISLESCARRPVGDVLSNVYSIGIFVAAEYQGMGVGTRLMEEMLVLAKRIHARMLILEVFETNKIAIKLYEKFGFVKAGKLPLWLQKGYTWSYIMYKKLS